MSGLKQSLFFRNLHGMVGWNHRVARLLVLVGSVAWLELLPVSSPHRAAGQDLDVEAAGTLRLLDDGWHPPRLLVPALSVVQGVDWISGLVLMSNLGNTFCA